MSFEYPTAYIALRTYLESLLGREDNKERTIYLSQSIDAPICQKARKETTVFS